MRKLSFSRMNLIVSLMLCLLLGSAVTAQDATPAMPDTVTIAGTVQSLLGCPGDWQPECEATRLTYDTTNAVWRGSFDLPAGSYEYKAAINGTWDLSYGLNADSASGSANIPLELAEDTTVTFYFDHHTGWITDDVNSLIITAPGSYQDEAGCPGEWQPDCLRSWLQDADGDGIYSYTSPGLPAGGYEFKIAVGLSWDENYGADGVPGGENIAIEVLEEGYGFVVTFDPSTTEIQVTGTTSPVAMAPTAPIEQPAGGGARGDVAQPDMVNIPGTIQPAIGCPGEWQPDCDVSQLTLDEEGQVWIGTFSLPAGSYEYKVAINGAWTENYGGFADQDGPNIPLTVPEDSDVTFIYSHATHWISDSIRHRIVTAPGSYQDEIGCAAEWDPACMRSWLQDVDGDGIYTLTIASMPAGDYEAKAAINRNWDENYGANGEADGANIPFTVPDANTPVTFAFDSAQNLMVVTVGGGGVSSSSIREAAAHWVTADTFAWNIDVNPGATYQLLSSPDASFTVGLTGVDPASQYVAYDLTPIDSLPDAVLAKFPHLAGYSAFQLSADDIGAVPDILRGQALIAEYNSGGSLVNLSGLQIPGVLDDLYTYDGALGLTFSDGVPTISVWAPTAQNVRLMLFADADTDDVTYMDMERDDATGVWSVAGEAAWAYQYYLFEVTVYAPTTLAIEVNEVTDPYSVSLSNNSQRSQIVDLNDPALMPAGWLDYERLTVTEPEDIVIYELHVRDFSIFDETVPEAWRGTYMAFTVTDSNGMTHLGNLADAGLTHVHLLPVFDIATINENRPRHFFPDYEAMAEAEPDSDFQQAQIDPIRDLDGFNWGYDPFHFNVPEGSYSTDSDGAQRILEFRSMVMALNQRGLSAVMDVVYNHTNASGQDRRSVFDRIVPGYYHRLTDTGRVATSTCCQNTATEHNMMRRFMVDSVVLWATAYHIDGFRFDLMGHHMVDDMVAVRTAVDGLTLDEHGVNGRAIYIYGEGWNFGEVANNARGINATQLNIGGTGIGVFNDRIRDAVRGGNPFGDYQYQGFVTGLFYEPNGITPGDEPAQRDRILLFGDQIRVGMAGNLRDYNLVSRTGDTVTGADVDYNGSPVGYTLDPQENINYVSAHDNETFWDIIQYKAAPDVTVADRVRMQNMAISIVGFSQGVPFYHAGIDMLRSKSFDRNSYNSGDWFNRLDFTYQTNNFGVGLPPAGDNSSQWEIQRPLLSNPDLYVTQADIMSSVTHMQEVLRIRRSSVLFRLRTGADVQARVGFHNTGVDQIPGVIVMSLDDMSDGLDDIDPDYAYIVVVVNARNDALTFTDEAFAGMALELHPVQVNSADTVVRGSAFDSDSGTFTVPARTVAVFVLPQG